MKKFGYESRNQECTIAVIEMLKEEGALEFDDDFVNAMKARTAQDMHEASVVNLREKLQYGVDIEFGEKRKFDDLVEMCKKVIDKTREIVHEK